MMRGFTVILWDTAGQVANAPGSESLTSRFKSLLTDFALNPSNAEATFAQSTKTQKSLKNI